MKSSLHILFFCCCLLARLGYAQDTTKTLSEVRINAIEVLRLKTLELNAQYIQRDLILVNQPQDLGTILQLVQPNWWMVTFNLKKGYFHV